MQAQLRLGKAGARVVLPQRRLISTQPPLPPTPPLSGAAPVRPVVVTSTTLPPVPGSSSLPPRVVTPGPLPTEPPFIPPPPPPPPPPPKKFFRRFLIYTSLGLITFYTASGYASTKSESYRDIFVTLPGGEAVADYADENHWETFGPGTVYVKTTRAWDSLTGKASTQPQRSEIGRDVDKAIAEGQRKADDLKQEARKAESKVSTEVKKVENRVVAKAEEAKATASSALAALSAKATELKDKAVAATTGAGDKAKAVGREAEDKAKSASVEAKAAGHQASEKAKAAGQEVAVRAQTLAEDAKEKVSETTEKVSQKFSEGVESIVREAEKALQRGEQAVVDAGKAVAPQPTGLRILPDTQRPRELRPETVVPEKPSFEGKEVYKGSLPLGFEPPPGYYIAPPPKPVAPVEGAPLPLLAPKVREFAASEPVISQLASTIDSLTSSLSSANANKPNDATGILTKAQDDLTALSTRIEEVKKAERAKLEKTIGDKTKEFEAVLAEKDEERKKGEEGLKQTWNQERAKLVEDWRHSLEGELESQREGIEKRLREEVVSQGIELQRRWLRSIKTQVETERGGRLARLDHLSTSLKQLERITLDNSATLDDNVRVHKIWSAIRAVNSKAEAGDLAFDEELRVLKSLVSEKSNSIIPPALSQIEASGTAVTGVKSFAALSSWFTNSVSPRIHSASLVPAPEEATVLSHLASLGLSKIMFKPQPGLIDGKDVGSVLARAEWCLSEKDLDGAAREVNSLSGWPGKLASDWLREARRKLEVQQALEVVMTEATLDSLLLS